MQSNEAGSGDTLMTQGGTSLVARIQRQSMLTPDATAIRAGRQSVSYQELHVRSSQLANYLVSLGASAGSVIGLCLTRSIEFPIAALAVLKLGAAYLPLEPKAPARRLQSMLESAKVRLAVSDSNTENSLPSGDHTVVALDTCAEAIRRCATEFAGSSIAEKQAAYVIFTSGSTGVPKPVAVGHGSLLNLVEWHNRAFNVTCSDRASQLASIGFDAAVWELWPYLAAGASVHFVDEETRTDPGKLRDFLVGEKISISFAPTPLAERMLRLSWAEKTSLRFLLTGADTLHFFPPKNLPFVLVNNYGPTECTVVSTSGAVMADETSSRLPSIGRPIDNVEIFILDDNKQKVSAGTIGEIYIGGSGLALGYLNDPALTAEKFVQHPFSSNASDRLYRTGDMGSWIEDGQIAFHGRIDDQVKVNGFRVELNDIASALRRHGNVREAVVSARENESGEKQLVGYVVPSSMPPTVSELREFLLKELPEYMVPAVFVKMESLPVGSSGKFDRRALPEPDHDNILRDEVFQHPTSVTEQRVGSIVSSLLGVQHVGVNDNFFYLGGNSLFGTQLIARLRDAFQVEVPLLKLFDHPTIAELSQEIDRMMVARVESMSEEEVRRLLATNSAQASL